MTENSTQDNTAQGEKVTWSCTVCGFEVEAVSLPPDYECPLCGEGVEAFVKL